MLLTDARRPARTGPDGGLIPMAEQDRSLWNADYIAEGVALITDALPRGSDRPVPAPGGDRRDPRRGAKRRGDRLAADHGAVRAADADLRQPGGGAEPRRRGGHGPRRRARGLTCSGSSRPTSGSPGTTGSTRSARTCWRWPVTAWRRATSYQAAARRTTSFPQQRYLHARAARLTDDQ